MSLGRFSGLALSAVAAAAAMGGIQSAYVQRATRPGAVRRQKLRQTRVGHMPAGWVWGYLKKYPITAAQNKRASKKAKNRARHKAAIRH